MLQIVTGFFAGALPAAPSARVKRHGHFLTIRAHGRAGRTHRRSYGAHRESSAAALHSRQPWDGRPAPRRIRRATLEYREIGNTGVQVSEIGFGGGGNAGLMVRGTPEQQREAVARAIELGINYFDQAPDYGDGVSETNLGRLMKELSFRPYLTTKSRGARRQPGRHRRARDPLARRESESPRRRLRRLPPDPQRRLDDAPRAVRPHLHLAVDRRLPEVGRRPGGAAASAEEREGTFHRVHHAGQRRRRRAHS